MYIFVLCKFWLLNCKIRFARENALELFFCFILNLLINVKIEFLDKYFTLGTLIAYDILSFGYLNDE
jgi:hypothetical protein